MTTNTSTPVSGSARALRPHSRLLGMADPKKLVQVTVRVRSRGTPPPAEKIGALPPQRRHYLSREEFEQAYGAAPADIEKVKDFARIHGLNVAAVNPAQRNVVLSGTVKAVSAAFQVKLMNYAHADGDYRGRIGRVHVPPSLAQIVEGVFGLDNRRQAFPHIVRAGRGAAPNGSFYSDTSGAAL